MFQFIKPSAYGLPSVRNTMATFQGTILYDLVLLSTMKLIGTFCNLMFVS